VNLTRQKDRSGRLVAATLFAGAVAYAMIGCGSGAGDYCNKARQCERGNDADEQACNERYNEGAKLADLRNCGAEFDDYQNCLQDNSRCKDHYYGTQSDQTCQKQQDALTKCLK
jgi:hypothetical protein